MSDERSGVFIPIPLPSETVFRYEAADDILQLLYRNPHRQYTITELRETTGHGGKSVDQALKILENLELIHRQKEGRKTLIQINQNNIKQPDDPLLSIPQEEFRTPVKAFLDQLDQTNVDVVGVILFGSVARGEADRASDIDIQIIVENDLLESRRSVQDIRQNIENRRFDGSRYEFQVLVESVESAESYGERLQEIFSEGIKLRETNELEKVQKAVFSG